MTQPWGTPLERNMKTRLQEHIAGLPEADARMIVDQVFDITRKLVDTTLNPEQSRRFVENDFYHIMRVFDRVYVRLPQQGKDMWHNHSYFATKLMPEWRKLLANHGYNLNIGNPPTFSSDVHVVPVVAPEPPSVPSLHGLHDDASVSRPSEPPASPPASRRDSHGLLPYLPPQAAGGEELIRLIRQLGLGHINVLPVVEKCEILLQEQRVHLAVHEIDHNILRQIHPGAPQEARSKLINCLAQRFRHYGVENLSNRIAWSQNPQLVVQFNYDWQTKQQTPAQRTWGGLFAANPHAAYGADRAKFVGWCNALGWSVEDFERSLSWIERQLRGIVKHPELAVREAVNLVDGMRIGNLRHAEGADMTHYNTVCVEIRQYLNTIFQKHGVGTFDSHYDARLAHDAIASGAGPQARAKHAELLRRYNKPTLLQRVLDGPVAQRELHARLQAAHAGIKAAAEETLWKPPPPPPPPRQPTPRQPTPRPPSARLQPPPDALSEGEMWPMDWAAHQQILGSYRPGEIWDPLNRRQ